MILGVHVDVSVSDEVEDRQLVERHGGVILQVVSKPKHLTVMSWRTLVKSLDPEAGLRSPHVAITADSLREGRRFPVRHKVKRRVYSHSGRPWRMGWPHSDRCFLTLAHTICVRDVSSAVANADHAYT